jgi:DNA-binding response OmpR family regulator
MQKRILVVAHSADAAESIPITLQLAGHKVALADSGLDAILWAETMRPDLIVVDDDLPDMDGSTMIGVLQWLPSTAALATILLPSRAPGHKVQSRGVRAENGALDSTELLRQVAFALALCDAARQEAARPHGRGVLDVE